MKVLLLYVLIVYVLIAVQALFFKGVKPDFVLVVVCYVSLKYGRAMGTSYGAVMGLLMDSINGFLLGPHIIAKSMAGFLVHFLKENFYEWNLLSNTLAILLFAVVNVMIISSCFEIFSGMPVSNRTLGVSVLEVIYTLIGSFILYPLLKPAQEGKKL